MLVARGVSDLIWREERPALLSDELISLIRETENSGEFDEAPEAGKKRTDLQIGGLVRVPEREMVGQLLALDDRGRAQILMEFLGRQVKPWVEAKTLQIVAA